jgi:hypothetical protein
MGHVLIPGLQSNMTPYGTGTLCQLSYLCTKSSMSYIHIHVQESAFPAAHTNGSGYRRDLSKVTAHVVSAEYVEHTNIGRLTFSAASEGWHRILSPSLASNTEQRVHGNEAVINRFSGG